MICREGSSIDIDSKEQLQQQQQQVGNNIMTTSLPASHGYATLQHRRKSQLITFSASSCDIKNSLSHEKIMGAGGATVAGAGAGPGSAGAGAATTGAGGSGAGSVRLSFAEEDVLILPPQLQQQQPEEVFRRRSLLEVEVGVEAGEDQLEEQQLVEHLVEVDEDVDEDAEEEEEHEDDDVEEDDVVELYLHDEFETHIDAKSNNANDDSGGGSYEDSHALHSSLGGSNRNSLEKDDDDIEVDVISTDVSCYDQLLGSSCNTRNGDDDDIATLIGDGDNYNKLGAVLSGPGGVGNGGAGGGVATGGITAGVGVGSIKATVGGGTCGLGSSGATETGVGGGVIYANPFMGL